MSFDLPDVAIGAIAAAIIVSIFSFLGLIIAKEQKTSEFRQAWINSLRQEISQLIASANAIHGGLSAGKGNGPVKTWETVRPDFVAINQAAANIRLRLNPSEELSRRVVARVDEIEALMAHGMQPDYRELNEKEKQLVAEAADLLKSEWSRVKKGEPNYRAARLFALILIIFLFIIVLISLVNSPVSGQEDNTISEQVGKLPPS